MIRESSLDRYRALEASGALQEQEKRLMRLVHRHFPLPAKFTRRELKEAIGWELSTVAGRCNGLVKAGYLVEFPETRGGGHLLQISQPRNAQPAAPAETPSTQSDTKAMERVAAAPKTAAAQVPPMATRRDVAGSGSPRVEPVPSAVVYPAPAAAPRIEMMFGEPVEVVGEKLVHCHGKSADGKPLTFSYVAVTVRPVKQQRAA